MKFPNFSKKQSIVGGAAVLVVAILIGVFSLGGDKTQEFVTDQVERGFLQQTVEVTGSLESVDHVDLSFNTTGNLESVYASVGDIVEKGEVLAELEAEDLKADVRRAQQSLAIASANLQLEIEGASDTAIAVQWAQVQTAQVALEAAETDLEKTQLTTAAALQKAQDDYENTVAQNELTLVEIAEDLVSSMKSAMIGVRYGLSEADEVLGVENTIVNDSFDDILSHQDPSALQNAVHAFEDAQESRDAAEEVIFDLTPESTLEEFEAAEDLLVKALDDIENTLLYTRKALDATTLETAEFTLTQLAALKTSIDTARDAVQLDEQNYYTQKQLYFASLQSVDTNLDNAENALHSAEVNAQTSVATAQAVLAMRQADFSAAQASYANFISEPREIDLAALQAGVASAQADLDAATARLEKAQIIAPIDGQVTDITLDIGEQVSAAMPFMTLQSTGDLFEVTLDVPEADIIKISVGDEASVEFDAYGDDIAVSGEVVEVSPGQKALEGVVYYEVTVMLDDVSDELSLKSGMSTDVTIITDEKQGVLYVPQRAVLEDNNNQKYVRVPKGSSYENVYVETGLRADGGLIEIKSGLEDGETIIVTILEK